MHNTKKHCLMMLLVVTTSWLAGPQVYGVVTGLEQHCGRDRGRWQTAPGGAYRAVAVVQTAVYDAVNAITKRYPPTRVPLQAALGRRSRPRWRRRIARRWPR